jgi:hypothetical protein
MHWAVYHGSISLKTRGCFIANPERVGVLRVESQMKENNCGDGFLVDKEDSSLTR